MQERSFIQGDGSRVPTFLGQHMEFLGVSLSCVVCSAGLFVDVLAPPFFFLFFFVGGRGLFSVIANNLSHSL